MLVLRGAEEARAAAGKLAALAGEAGGEAGALVEERVRAMGRAARAYEPPPLPTYRRTGRLARSWRVRRAGGGWSLGSDAPYARFVRGRPSGGGQAWMHAGRWRPLSDIAARALDLRAALVRRLSRLVRARR